VYEYFSTNSHWRWCLDISRTVEDRG